jgi:hypothetical protein
MNLGMYDYLLEAYDQYGAEMALYSQLCSPRPAGLVWNSDKNIVIEEKGLHVSVDSLPAGPCLELTVDHNDDYEFIFLRGNKELARIMSEIEYRSRGGLRFDTLCLSDTVPLAEIDKILVIPGRGDGKFSVGHIRFLPQ